MAYNRITLEEREEISRLLANNQSISSITHVLNRHKSTLSREIRRKNRDRKTYRGHFAHRDALSEKKKGGRKQKLVTNIALKKVVLTWLKLKWSPEQIMNRLKVEYPDDSAMRISHETIYRYLYVLPKGNLRTELLSHLRKRQKFRRKRTNKIETRGRIPEMKSISERPTEVLGRKIPGHWEGDLILGKERKCAMGTLCERTTRFTLLVKLMGRDTDSIQNAFIDAFKTIPKELRKTLTYDQGYEMKQHILFTKKTKIEVYFAHPGSPWERGTNENTNGLVRQYFPKSTNFREISLEHIKQVQKELNDRPRKCLGYKKPSEVLFDLLQ